jgi:hypothetical protein
MDRISRNEKKLNDILFSISKLEDALELFKNNISNIESVNKYYGSKAWFKDKDMHDKGIISCKAGVLSEDAVWNMNEYVNDLISDMRDIISFFDSRDR